MDRFDLRRPWSARGAMLVMAGAAAIALLPLPAGASSSDAGGLAALVQQVQALSGQTDANTAEIATLKAQVAALQAGGGSDNGAATLAAANSYTDTQVKGEAAARSAADTGLQNQLNAEVARAEAAESAAITTAMGSTEANLTSLASNTVQGAVVTDATSFWQAIAAGNWP